MNERPAPTDRGLGEVIRRRRVALGLSQEALAERASGAGDEVRQSDVSRLELGKVALPRRPRLERLAKALGMPLGELLARSGWAGAEDALAPPVAARPVAAMAAPGPASTAGAQASAPASPPVVPRAAGDDQSRRDLGPVGNARLRDAIAQSHAVRHQAKEVLRRATEVYDRAAYPPAHGRSRGTDPGGAGEHGS